MRFEREPAVRRIEDRDVTTGREHAVILVDLPPTCARRQVLDDAGYEHDVEGRIRIRQRARLLVRQLLHLAHTAQAELLDLRSHERGIRVEAVHARHLGLVGDVLGHVAERAADLEQRELRRTTRPQPREQRAQKQLAARALEVEVERRTVLALALDEQAQDPLAVVRAVVASGDGEDAVIAAIDDVEGTGRHHGEV